MTPFGDSGIPWRAHSPQFVACSALARPDSSAGHHVGIVLAFEAVALAVLVWKAGWDHMLQAIAVDNFDWIARSGKTAFRRFAAINAVKPARIFCIARGLGTRDRFARRRAESTASSPTRSYRACSSSRPDPLRGGWLDMALAVPRWTRRGLGQAADGRHRVAGP